MSSRGEATGVSLLQYSDLLRELVVRDLKIKYRKSVLGYLWSTLNPLFMMIVLTVVFAHFFRFDVEHYSVYLLAGQLLFSFYADATSMAMNSILNGAALIQKVYLPKYVFPLARVLSSFITMLFSLLALLIVMVADGVEFHAAILMVPFVLLYLFVFSLGIGFLMSVVVIFFRDMEHLYSVLLSVIMYLTPIIYPFSILPEKVKSIVLLNPITSYVEFFRGCVLYGQWPTWEMHLRCIAWALSALLVGSLIFMRYQKKFILYL